MTASKTRIKDFRLNFRKVHRSLGKQDEYKAYLQKLADKAEEALKAEMDDNRSRKPNISEAGDERTREYFKNNVRGKIVKGKKFTFVSVQSNGNNAVDYEAEHANFPRAIFKLGGTS